MAGELFVVATPIGNLEDVTLRALRVLGEVDLICAEDTRVTRRLLSRYDIHTPLTSYNEHTQPDRQAEMIGLLSNGSSIALVTDAGTPAISDPGSRLVTAARDAGVNVTPVPGPSAVTCAVSVAALPTSRYAFEGFPPRAKGDRRAFFQGLMHHEHAIVLFEAPTRLLATLEDLRQTLGDRAVLVARELTKIHETHYMGLLSEVIPRLRVDSVRGECTIVVYPPPPEQLPAASPDQVDELLREALARGTPPAKAAREVSLISGADRRSVYSALVRLRNSAGCDAT